MENLNQPGGSRFDGGSRRWAGVAVGNNQLMDLDHWVAEPALRTFHRRDADVSRAALWSAASSVRLRELGLLGRLIRARIPGLDPGMTCAEMFRGAPFNRLEEGPAHLLSGLCGRIWTVRRDFTVLEDPAEFREWRVPGTVRVLFAIWAEDDDGGSRLTSEVRVDPVDRRAAVYLRAMEPFIGAFQGLIARDALAAATRRAEQHERNAA